MKRNSENGLTVVLRELQTIPGVGPSISRDLVALGVRRVADLRGRDPESMYRTHERQRGEPVDRCLLYVFRCAVYYASTVKPDTELLKWWNWKDRTVSSRQMRSRAWRVTVRRRTKRKPQ